MRDTLGLEGPSVRPRGRIFWLPLGSPAPEVLRFSLWKDVLRRVEVGVGDRATVGADELYRLVASVAWQARQVRAG